MNKPNWMTSLLEEKREPAPKPIEKMVERTIDKAIEKVPFRPTHEAITKSFAHWDAIDIHYRGACLRSGGHGFSGIARKELLLILQERCRELGIERQRDGGAERARELRRRDEIAGRSDLRAAGAVVTEPGRIERELHVAGEVDPTARRLNLAAYLGDERGALKQRFVARDRQLRSTHRLEIMGISLV